MLYHVIRDIFPLTEDPFICNCKFVTFYDVIEATNFVEDARNLLQDSSIGWQDYIRSLSKSDLSALGPEYKLNPKIYGSAKCAIADLKAGISSL